MSQYPQGQPAPGQYGAPSTQWGAPANPSTISAPATNTSGFSAAPPAGPGYAQSYSVTTTTSQGQYVGVPPVGVPPVGVPPVGAPSVGLPTLGAASNLGGAVPQTSIPSTIPAVNPTGVAPQTAWSSTPQYGQQPQVGTTFST